MQSSIFILFYGGIFLLPFCSSIRCICKCTQSNGNVVLEADVIREPPYTECVNDSECDQPCRSSISIPSCTMKGACDRRATSTRSTASLSSTISQRTTPTDIVQSTSISTTPSKWEGTYLVDVKSCDSNQCCCPTDKIVITRMIANKPDRLSIVMKLSGSDKMCGLITNVNEDDIVVLNSLLVTLPSAFIVIGMNDNDTNTIDTTYWNGPLTCRAKATRTSASPRTIGEKQLLYMFTILSLVLVF
jgi:hypothetical protein